MSKRKRQVQASLSNGSGSEDESSSADLQQHLRWGNRVKAQKGGSDGEMVTEDGTASNASSGSSLQHRDRQSSSESNLEHDAASQSSPQTLFNGAFGADSENPSRDTSELTMGAMVKDRPPLDRRKKRLERSSSDQKSESSEDEHKEAAERKAGKGDKRDFDRPSKHAPMELSSKKAVSRKRSVVPIHKIMRRDPRFEPAIGKVNDDQVKKNYAFLSGYRESEIAELKAGLRKAKDPIAKETLKRALTSMESKKRTERLNEQRQEVVRQHRREEKEKVRQGKTPFYLKNSEVKERALKERYEAMKGKEREKAIARRTKKMASRERKNMPQVRRA